MLGCFVGAFVVIGDELGRRNSAANPIKKNQRHSALVQSLQMRNITCLTRNRHHDGISPTIQKQRNNLFLAIYILVCIVNEQVIAMLLHDLFYSIDHLREKIIDSLRNHDRNRFTFVFSETSGKRIGLIIHFFGHADHLFLGFFTDFVTIIESPGYCRWRKLELCGQFF